MNIKLVFDDKPILDDINQIQKGLDHFNETKLQQHPKEFAIYLRDDKNEIHGGISVLTYTDSMHVILLWVEEECRSKGYGAMLLKAAEEEGMKRNCQFAFVDTFEFQGKEFYLKNGYQCIGNAKNVLLDHDKILLKKILKQDAKNESIQIKNLNPVRAENLCREITADLPEYFGIPDANDRYAKGMLERISFSASQDEQYIGLLTVEMPFANNANIYWMGVKKQFQGMGIGSRLIQHVETYCRNIGSTSLTVETVSPKNQDQNYLKTYQFYQRLGFMPLFELNTYGPDFLMIYIQKIL